MKLKQKLATRYARAQLNILSLVSLRKAAVQAFRLFCTPRKRARGKYPDIFETGQPLSFRLDGHRVRGHRWQPYSDALLTDTDAPKKVLIAHGFESSSRSFEGYIRALLKKGYEVVAFDAPAHGASGGRRLFIDSYTRMLAYIEENYGPFQSWLGHSLGGLALTLSLEELSPEGTCRFALIAPATGLAEALDGFAESMHLPAEVVREIEEYVKETSAHPLAWYSLRRAFAQIRADVLYVQDEEDTVTPAKCAKEIRQDAHPNIRFLFTSGLGHRKLYKDQEIIEQVVDFL
jgi:pimeloyl-ACP methyl ester carboxylesterase